MTRTKFEVDLGSLHSIAHLITSGVTTPELLVDAFYDELELVEVCVVIRESSLYVDDGYAEFDYSHDTDPGDAAQQYVDTGDYGAENKTSWVEVRSYRKGVDGEGRIEHVNERSWTIAIEAEEPDCADGQEHKWESPYAILGGLKENPGVWGHGGGVIINEVCMRCGCGKTTDTWAQHPSNGEQGLTSVEYEEGKYSVGGEEE